MYGSLRVALHRAQTGSCEGPVRLILISCRLGKDCYYLSYSWVCTDTYSTLVKVTTVNYFRMLTNPAPNLCCRIKLLAREQLLCTEYRVQSTGGSRRRSRSYGYLLPDGSTTNLSSHHPVYSLLCTVWVYSVVCTGYKINFLDLAIQNTVHVHGLTLTLDFQSLDSRTYTLTPCSPYILRTTPVQSTPYFSTYPVIDHPAYWVDRHEYSTVITTLPYSWVKKKKTTTKAEEYRPKGREIAVERGEFFGGSLFVR